MIIVSGIQRTGTSLMMEILGKNGLKILKDDMLFEKDNFFKDLQPQYNEHPLFTAKGLTKETIKGREKEFQDKRLCCKLMATSLDKTDAVGLKYIDKIIIMVRDWKSQTASWKPVVSRNITNLLADNPKIKELVLKVNDGEEFVKDRLYPDGVLYAVEYIKILNFVYRNKLQKKCIIICFDHLMDKFDLTSDILQKHIGIKLKNKGLIKKKVRRVDDKKYDFKEFKEGFFDFLDKLEDKLRYGSMDRDFLLEYERWRKIINQEVRNKEKFTQEKYGFSINTK